MEQQNISNLLLIVKVKCSYNTQQNMKIKGDNSPPPGLPRSYSAETDFSSCFLRQQISLEVFLLLLLTR